MEEEDSRAAYEGSTRRSDVVTDELRTGPLPDVLSVYPRADSYAHVAKKAPMRRASTRASDGSADRQARRSPARAGALENRFVVVTADHGHTEVRHDDGMRSR